MYTEQDYSNSLCHYGVKGQSWGNRRFQNLDGSYTPLGERHRLEQLARTGHIVRPGSATANREQLARTGNTVRVNTVSPGNIEPDNRYPEMSYLDRSGTYDECANLICFLASDEASFITGEDFVVDGGRRKI